MYYFNTRTKQSLWEKPSGFVAEATEGQRSEARTTPRLSRRVIFSVTPIDRRQRHRHCHPGTIFVPYISFLHHR